MYKYFLILFIILTSCATQSVITKESIQEISVLIFESDMAMTKFLETRNTKKLRGILTTALMTTRNNLLNYNTTRTEISNNPYKYQYVLVYDSLKWDVLTKESYRYWHDPSHPDALLDGEKSGYVRYPDIDKFVEDNNITKILDILFSICR